jgi:hypothetical protein
MEENIKHCYEQSNDLTFFLHLEFEKSVHVTFIQFI